MTAVVGLIALAQLGIEQTSSSASSGPDAARHETTSLDHARTALPLPRTVAMAPVDEGRSVAAERRAQRGHWPQPERACSRRAASTCTAYGASAGLPS